MRERSRRTAALLAALGLLGLSAPGPARGAARVAVLPMLPEGSEDPREGWALSVKLVSGIERRHRVMALDWAELARVMESRGLDKRSLRDREVLRRIGEAVKADAVFAGSFRTEGTTAVAAPVLIDVRGGRLRRGARRRFDRDFVVEPPVLDQEESLAMRDAPADYAPCEAAAERVDGLERRILDLKARYWALQLSRGVPYAALKFNPGSTITDPALKKALYGRMKQWLRQPIVPELTPHEIQQFAEADGKAFEIARRCGIL